MSTERGEQSSASNGESSSSRLKSRWDSPPMSQIVLSPATGNHSPGRASVGSPVSCPICLGQPENKSFTDKCFHEFCFTCLVEWSKVKAECPLCKQAFNRIIHSVQSMDQYEEYQVPEERNSPEHDYDPWSVWGFHPPFNSFRYRSTVADPESRRRLAIERRLRQFHYENFVLPPGPRPMRPRRRPHTTGSFRRQVYEDNMWSQLMPDVTGSLREASPRFFSENPAMTHRLVPWLNRELSVLVTANNDPQQIQNLIEMILELLKTHHILSRDFRRHLEPHVGRRAKHFQYELHTFARSPYDVAGYDQNVQFIRRGEEESSDSGSEIEVLEEISPGRSGVPRDQIRNSLVGYMPTTSRSDVIDRVLRLLHNRSSPQPGPSGTDDAQRSRSPQTWDSSDNDLEVVATLKPKHERTPVLVNLTSDEEPPVEEPIRKSKNGERLKRLMRQQLESATASASSTPDFGPGPSRRRIASSESDSTSLLSRIRKEKKRSYRKEDYDSSDSDFEPNRRTKSPRRISEEPDSSDSEVDRKHRKKHKKSKDESKKKDKKDKHKHKHKRKRSKERSSKASDSGSSRSHTSKSKHDKDRKSSKSKRAD